MRKVREVLRLHHVAGWDGVLPKTVLGDGVGAFLSMPAQPR